MSNNDWISTLAFWQATDWFPPSLWTGNLKSTELHSTHTDTVPNTESRSLCPLGASISVSTYGLGSSMAMKELFDLSCMWKTFVSPPSMVPHIHSTENHNQSRCDWVSICGSQRSEESIIWVSAWRLIHPSKRINQISFNPGRCSRHRESISP